MEQFANFNSDDDLAPIDNIIARFSQTIPAAPAEQIPATMQLPDAHQVQLPSPDKPPRFPTIKTEPIENDQLEIQEGGGRPYRLGLVEMDSMRAFQGAVYQQRWQPNRET